MVTGNGQPDKIGHPKKRAFLVAFARVGVVSECTKIAGVRRQTHYEWLANDPDYAQAFKDADETHTERMELEADRRAIEGWEEPVYQGGVMVGTKLKFSDTLLIFRLKAKAPEKYRERFEVSSKDAELDAQLDDEVNRLVAVRQNTLGSESPSNGNGNGNGK